MWIYLFSRQKTFGGFDFRVEIDERETRRMVIEPMNDTIQRHAKDTSRIHAKYGISDNGIA